MSKLLKKMSKFVFDYTVKTEVDEIPLRKEMQ